LGDILGLATGTFYENMRGVKEKKPNRGSTSTETKLMTKLSYLQEPTEGNLGSF